MAVKVYVAAHTSGTAHLRADCSHLRGSETSEYQARQDPTVGGGDWVRLDSDPQPGTWLGVRVMYRRQARLLKLCVFCQRRTGVVAEGGDDV